MRRERCCRQFHQIGLHMLHDSLPDFGRQLLDDLRCESMLARRTTSLRPLCALRFSRSRRRVLCKSGDPFLLPIAGQLVIGVLVARRSAAFMTSVTSNACTNLKWGPRVGVCCTRYARKLPRSATMMSEVAVIPSQRGRHSRVSARARAIPAEKFRGFSRARPDEVFAASTLNTASVNRIGLTFRSAAKFSRTAS